MSVILTNILKIISFVVIPLAAFLYVLLHLPFSEAVAGTLVMSSAFIAVRAQKRKYDGNLEVVEKDTSLIHKLDIHTSPEELGKQKSMTLRVVKVPLVLPKEESDSQS